MTAVQTKEHAEDKPDGIRKEKVKKVGSQAQQNLENRAQGVRSNNVSGLCCKAEPGTLSHNMPSFSCSYRQRYQVIW